MFTAVLYYSISVLVNIHCMLLRYLNQEYWEVKGRPNALSRGAVLNITKWDNGQKYPEGAM